MRANRQGPQGPPPTRHAGPGRYPCGPPTAPAPDAVPARVRCVYRSRRMRGPFEHRRAVRRRRGRVHNRRGRVHNRRWRVLNRRWRVLNRRRRVLNRRGRVLNRSLGRGVCRRLLDHRRTRCAVAGWTAGTRALDDRAGVRRQPVAARRTARGSATGDGRFVPSANCRPVLSRDSATVRDGPASSQRRTFLAQDSAVSSAGRRSGTRAGGVSAAANPRGDSAGAAGVGPQTGSTRNGGSLRLRRRVAAQYVALAA